MQSKAFKRALAPLILAAGGLLASCYGPEYTEAGIIVGGPPPGVRVEARIAAAGPGYIWTPGYWDWNDHWGWIGGSWQLPPHPRARWVAPHYQRSHGQWKYYRGHWN